MKSTLERAAKAVDARLRAAEDTHYRRFSGAAGVPPGPSRPSNPSDTGPKTGDIPKTRPPSGSNNDSDSDSNTPPASDTNDKASKTIAMKMSKSNPDNAIFMTDTFEDIQRKINKAYCLEGDIKENPILEYCKYIIFESFDRLGTDSFVIERPEKWGGRVILN